jgi:HEAT repeat protein
MRANVSGAAIRRLERLLLIRQGERRFVIYFAICYLLIGIGLAIGRGTADALFFKRYGIQYLPVMYMILSGVLVAVSAVYAAFVDRMPAERSFAMVGGVLIVVLVACWSGMAFTESTFIYPVYFLVYEVASEILLLHGAIYIAQNLDTLSAKRLAPIILAGSQVGTIVGGMALAAAAPLVGVQNLLLAWGLVLGIGIALAGWWHRAHGASPHFRAPRKLHKPVQDAVSQVTAGLRMTRDSSLLRYSALALFFMVITFYILCYSANRIYTHTFTSEATLAGFFGALTAVNSLLSLLLQIFVTNRAIERFGVRRINLFYPATTFLSLVGLAFHFGFPTALFASLNKETIMPAFRNPVRAMFFNVLPAQIQGRARAMSILLVMPVALLVTGGILWAVQRLDNPIHFVLPGLVAAALYIYYSHRMNRGYVEALLSHLKARHALPSDRLYAEMRGSGGSVLEVLVDGVAKEDEEVAFSFARALVASYPEQAVEPILGRLRNMSPAGADRMIRLLPSIPHALGADLLSIAEAGDTHLKATVIETLVRSGYPDLSTHLQAALRADGSRLVVAGISGVLRGPVEALRAEAIEAWHTLLQGGLSEQLCAMRLIGDIDRLSEAEAQSIRSRYQALLPVLLEEAPESSIAQILDGLSAWTGTALPEIAGHLERLSTVPDPDVRAQAVRCLPLLPSAEQRERLVLQALEDAHQKVRNAALEVLHAGDDAFESLVQRWIVSGNRGSPRAQATLLEALIEGQGLPIPTLLEIADSRAQDARRLDQARRMLGATGDRADPAMALLEHIVTERMRQDIDLALLALQRVLDRETIAAIRAALKSGDQRERANACEALSHLEAGAVTRTLSELLRSADEDEQDAVASGQFENLDAVLRWCSERQDVWLSHCAGRAVPLRRVSLEHG